MVKLNNDPQHLPMLRLCYFDGAYNFRTFS